MDELGAGDGVEAGVEEEGGVVVDDLLGGADAELFEAGEGGGSVLAGEEVQGEVVALEDRVGVDPDFAAVPAFDARRRQ